MVTFNFVGLTPEDIYSQHLKTVGEISFTRREIDIIACLLSGRAAKTIASFLMISPKTVETHMRNIMLKVGGNSRESVIDFMEKAGKFSVARKHYQYLLIEAGFEKRLKEASALIEAGKYACILAYEQDDQALFVSYIQKHLSTAGVQTKVSKVTIQKLIESPPSQTFNTVIYAVSEETNRSFLSPLTSPSPLKIIFILPTIESAAALTKEEYLVLTEQENCYLFVFDILKRLLPETSLEKILLEFKTEYEVIMQGSADYSLSPAGLEAGNLPSSETTFKGFFHKLEKQKFWTLAGIIICFSIVALGLLLGIYTQILPDNNLKGLSFRSELPVPTEKFFLQRPSLIKQIEDSFKGSLDIQTVALLGIGGAGKTTLARQYARTQKSSIIWEINAETRESLLNSFEDFAYTLSKTTEEKGKLKEIQTLKNLKEREEQVISFVKNKLRAIGDWVLIFDNVEKMGDIQHYFPTNPACWGKGKILITSRNNHLSHNNYINNVIPIGELSKDEKLIFFRRIMNDQNEEKSFVSSKEQDQEFLAHIPSFPLDISIAAHYLKATRVPYVKYLEYLNKNDGEFDNIQKEILKETNEYMRTRYNIITLSLKNIIETNKDFMNLLIFISALNSQNIPKDLLLSYKGHFVVDSFIYHLKKYSLITDGLSLYSNSTFTIHRSTQAISLDYLTKGFNQKNNQVIQEITNALGNYMAEVTDKEDIFRMKLMISHCETYLEHHNLLAGIKKGFIKGALGSIYFYLGINYLNAKKILEDNLEYLNTYEPENYSAIIRTSGYLANVYRILGSYEECQSLLTEKLQNYKDYFLKNQTHYAWFLGWLGIVHRELGNYEKAKTSLEQGLAIYRRYPCVPHNKIAWILAYLGWVYKDLGDLAMAKASLEESVTIYRKYFPPTHSRIGWSLALLGSVYKDMGDHKKAETLIKEGITICKNDFFENHEALRYQAHELANLYIDTGKYDKAKDLLEQNLKIYKKYYNKNNIANARVLMSLGRLFLLKGDWNVAEDYTKQALEVLQQKGHPDRGICRENLAHIYSKKSKNNRAPC